MRLKTPIFFLTCFFLTSSLGLSREAQPPYDADVRGFTHVQGWGSAVELLGAIIVASGYGIHYCAGPVANPTNAAWGQMKLGPRIVVIAGIFPSMFGFFTQWVGAIGTFNQLTKK